MISFILLQQQRTCTRGSIDKRANEIRWLMFMQRKFFIATRFGAAIVRQRGVSRRSLRRIACLVTFLFRWCAYRYLSIVGRFYQLSREHESAGCLITISLRLFRSEIIASDARSFLFHLLSWNRWHLTFEICRISRGNRLSFRYGRVPTIVWTYDVALLLYLLGCGATVRYDHLWWHIRTLHDIQLRTHIDWQSSTWFLMSRITWTLPLLFHLEWHDLLVQWIILCIRRCLHCRSWFRRGDRQFCFSTSAQDMGGMCSGSWMHFPDEFANAVQTDRWNVGHASFRSVSDGRGLVVLFLSKSTPKRTNQSGTVRHVCFDPAEGRRSSSIRRRS